MNQDIQQKELPSLERIEVFCKVNKYNAEIKFISRVINGVTKPFWTVLIFGEGKYLGKGLAPTFEAATNSAIDETKRNRKPKK